ncbi:MAG: ferredoxin [Candidatus Aenigmatarchaeota archaeon]|nr:4Fe-4S binding protein [Candidatus Aenigmarchaeota archaeon]RLJ05031.1 MAG: ferredoxin [Candidatus Aenigmarchaeota archaeon]
MIINKEKCLKCGGCVSVCPVQALKLESELKCDNDKCIKCKACINFCPVGALKLEVSK